jgi:hypothetical protein
MDSKLVETSCPNLHIAVKDWDKFDVDGIEFTEEL